MLKRGWIEPSLAPYGASFFFVPKPNGRGLREVCDFRAINSITRKVLPSFPLFENSATQLEGAKTFSGLDLTSQFYQIWVAQTDVPKTSFCTCQGLYNLKVTPMGMTGSVGTAMNCMQQVLQHVISFTRRKTCRKTPAQRRRCQNPRKWQKCNLVSGHGLCGQRHGLAMNWVDRPRTSKDERDVIWAPRCRDCHCVWAVAGFGRFFINLSFLREQSP